MYERLEELRSKLDRPSFELLKDMKDPIVVEIGVQYGINAKNILENYNIKTLYLVDPYEEYLNTGKKVTSLAEMKEVRDIAKEYLKEYNNIIWIEKYSWEAAKDIPNDLDFVYIDGDHSYEATKKDIEIYYPKVRIGGVIAGHDFKETEVGVIKAVYEFFKNKYIEVGGLWDWWYVKDK